jgi:hypothetical protein
VRVTRVRSPSWTGRWPGRLHSPRPSPPRPGEVTAASEGRLSPRESQPRSSRRPRPADVSHTPGRAVGEEAKIGAGPRFGTGQGPASSPGRGRRAAQGLGRASPARPGIRRLLQDHRVIGTDQQGSNRPVAGPRLRPAVQRLPCRSAILAASREEPFRRPRCRRASCTPPRADTPPGIARASASARGKARVFLNSFSTVVVSGLALTQHEGLLGKHIPGRPPARAFSSGSGAPGPIDGPEPAMPAASPPTGQGRVQRSATRGRWRRNRSRAPAPPRPEQEFPCAVDVGPVARAGLGAGPRAPRPGQFVKHGAGWQPGGGHAEPRHGGRPPGPAPGPGPGAAGPRQGRAAKPLPGIGYLAGACSMSPYQPSARPGPGPRARGQHDRGDPRGQGRAEHGLRSGARSGSACGALGHRVRPPSPPPAGPAPGAARARWAPGSPRPRQGRQPLGTREAAQRRRGRPDREGEEDAAQR